MASRRTKSISTKVTPDEYERLAALAGVETISEWARRVLLHSDEASTAESTVLAELIALRTILLNMHFAICADEKLTRDQVARFIASADRDKHRLAAEQLRVDRAGRTS
jgi:hypothetical protein